MNAEVVRLPTELLFTEEQRQMIRDTYANGASDNEFAVLMEIAKARRLNPLLKQIHFVSRYDSQKQRSVWACQVSIDGLRAIAERTGLYAGQDEPVFVEQDGKLVCAKVAVWRKDWQRPAVGVAYWSEYVQTTRDGKPTRFWQQMPHVMLGKVAESAALRKAFPEDMSGLYTPEEMAQADNDRRDPYGPHNESTGEHPALNLSGVQTREQAALAYVASTLGLKPDDSRHEQYYEQIAEHCKRYKIGNKSELRAAINDARSTEPRRAIAAPVTVNENPWVDNANMPLPYPPTPVLATPERPIEAAVQQAAARQDDAAPELLPYEAALVALADNEYTVQSVARVWVNHSHVINKLGPTAQKRARQWAIDAASAATPTADPAQLREAIRALEQPQPPTDGGSKPPRKRTIKDTAAERVEQQASNDVPVATITKELDPWVIDEAKRRDFLGADDGRAWQAYLRTKHDHNAMGSYLKRRSLFERRGIDKDRRESLVWELASRKKGGLVAANAALDAWLDGKEKATLKVAS